MFASLAALTETPIQEGVAPDSRNYLTTLLGKTKIGREYVIEQAGSLSVSNSEWKYIAPGNGPAYNKLTNTELGNSKEPQLYNLKKDRGEKVNQVARYPEKVKSLQSILDKEKAKQ